MTDFGARLLPKYSDRLEIENPGEVIGTNPLALIGGTGACGSAHEKTGAVKPIGTHPTSRGQPIEVAAAAPMKHWSRLYSVSSAALSQSTSPALSSGLPTSMVAPRRSAEGSCDRSHCMYPMPVTMSRAKR